jgi:hypothetical protein
LRPGPGSKVKRTGDDGIPSCCSVVVDMHRLSKVEKG